MTGYGSENFSLRGQNYQIEIKCLNSKGFDLTYKSPSVFRNLEIEVKNKLQQILERGKIEVYVGSKDGKRGFMSIDESSFVQQYQYLSALATKVDAKTDVFPIVIDKYSSLAEIDEMQDEEKTSFLTMIESLCAEVNSFRKIEGEKTTSDIRVWLEQIKSTLDQIALREPTRIVQKKEKLLSSMQETLQHADIDYNRLSQEMIFYIEKLDVSEEISRLTQHLILFDQTIDEEGNTGKKLGFVAQEMGREINTIGSKANDVEIQHYVVDMKDYLERIKEQLNNIL